MQVYLSNKTIENEDDGLPEKFTSINLNEKEVKAAKKMIFKFIDSIKNISMDKKIPTLYFTSLIVMNIISQDLIKAHSPEEMREILSATKKQDIEE